jgi:hypothetical protein
MQVERNLLSHGNFAQRATSNTGVGSTIRVPDRKFHHKKPKRIFSHTQVQQARAARQPSFCQPVPTFSRHRKTPHFVYAYCG